MDVFKFLGQAISEAQTEAKELPINPCDDCYIKGLSDCCGAEIIMHNICSECYEYCIDICDECDWRGK
ncbi:MAG: hypothetical protein MUO72_09685 [Bacteroidales bacterium]|nr:hypothetical protein [Bacteroidales bacterium]